jgi:hypothetical protein
MIAFWVSYLTYLFQTTLETGATIGVTSGLVKEIPESGPYDVSTPERRKRCVNLSDATQARKYLP